MQLPTIMLTALIAALNAAAVPALVPEVRTDWAAERNAELSASADLRNDIPVMFLGDSITQLWDFPADHQHSGGHEVWERFFAPLDAANYGVSGDTIQNVLYRITEGNQLASQPRVIVLLIGTNNLHQEPASSPDEITAGVANLIREIRKRSPESRILLLGLLPREGDYPITEINAGLAQLAVTDRVDYLDAAPGILRGEAFSRRYFRDGLHLSGEGYGRFAETLHSPIRRLLAAQELEHPRLAPVRAEAVIALPEDATEAERNAALELQYFFSRMYGATPEITANPPAGIPVLRLGVSDTVRQLLPDVDFDTLRPDEIVIRRVGGELIVTGARPAGTLWAVYTLLQDVLGVNFYSSYEIETPHYDQFELPDVAIRYAPVFHDRNAFYYDTWKHPRHAVRLRNNSAMTGLTGWGALPPFAVPIHSFDRIIPADKYLASHPEWFSLRDGVRVGGQLAGQLCLTNDTMKAEFIRNLCGEIRRHPESNVASVSQNDNMFPCQCPACRASDAEYGGPSGTLIRFVNDIAAAVEREFPGFRIETFAYQYTVDLPASDVIPRDNVIVRLCSIGCDFSQPLKSAGNADFMRQLQGWGKIARELVIWNYVANFSNQLTPFPDFTTQGIDLRSFAANGVTGVMEQGAWNNGYGADFVALRTWLVSQLVWNPALDQWELIERFADGYYREAAPFILAYLRRMEAEIQQAQVYFGCFGATTTWLRPETILEGYELMRQARQAVAGSDPVIVERVRLAASPIQCVLLERAPALQRRFPEQMPDLPSLLADTVAVLERNETPMYSESESLAVYCERLRQCAAEAQSRQPESIAPPAIAATLGARTYYVIEENLLGNPIVDDSAAANGRAVKLACDVYNWSVQYRHNMDAAPLPRGRYRVIIAARADGAPTPERAFEIGSYDLRSRKQESKNFTGKDVAGAEYRECDAGIFELAPDAYLYLAPTKNDALQSLFIDRIIIVPE